jgi:hypothetical protein
LQEYEGSEWLVLRAFIATMVVVLATLACQGSSQQSGEATLTPDEQGVLHDLTETTATDVLGFQPVRPIDLPPGLRIAELWGQASFLRQSAPELPAQWGAPYVAIYEIQPKDEAAMQGAIGAIQLHQSTVDPIPGSPGGIAEWQSITLGTQVVQKSVNPIGTTGNANAVYRWDLPAQGLHLLAIASMRDLAGVDAVEAMIAEMTQ